MLVNDVNLMSVGTMAPAEGLMYVLVIIVGAGISCIVGVPDVTSKVPLNG